MAELTDTSDIRETVRERYARAARRAASGAYDDARALQSESGCCGSEVSAVARPTRPACLDPRCMTR